MNFLTLSGLEPLVTYEMSIAAYTLTGVGKKSDIISVNTTFGKVVFFSVLIDTVSFVFVMASCDDLERSQFERSGFGPQSGRLCCVRVTNSHVDSVTPYPL